MAVLPHGIKSEYVLPCGVHRLLLFQPSGCPLLTAFFKRKEKMILRTMYNLGYLIFLFIWTTILLLLCFSFPSFSILNLVVSCCLCVCVHVCMNLFITLHPPTPTRLLMFLWYFSFLFITCMCLICLRVICPWKLLFYPKASVTKR